uniref:Reverse transcriptase Ty1/copia-type domain-containing protein n=1 Tax=Cannabis sativa TaxID=3483 RepID=A0A803PJG2_CANSA
MESLSQKDILQALDVETEPKSLKAALASPIWNAAMSTEVTALKRKKTWVLVPPTSDMTIVHNKWVYRVKYNKDGSVDRHKARLVAKGFQQLPGIDFFETYSPVNKPCTIQIIFTLAATFGWDIQQVDINNAFLNGDHKEDVYMYQPQGFIDSEYPNHVCKLNKAIYGVRQAPRAWFYKLKSSLLQWGFQNSKSDSSLFYTRQNGHLLLLLVYVYDILITGENMTHIQQVITQLHDQFALKKLGFVNYFLGFEVNRSTDTITLTQQKYTRELLNNTQLIDSKPQTTPMCSTTKLSSSVGTPMQNPTTYRSVIGALQYLTTSRPDIAFPVNKLSQFMQSPTSEHWSACKRNLRYLSGTLDRGLTVKAAKTLDLQGFTDADWAGSYDDRKSTSGYCIFFGGNLLTVSNCPILWCDNFGAGSLASNHVFHARTKHIEVNIHFVRDKVLAQELDVRYVDSPNQLADLFTKPLAASPFLFFKDKLTLSLPQCHLRGGIGDIGGS